MSEQHIAVLRQDIELHSEEVQEILGQIPHWIIRWGITIIFLVIALLLTGCWFFHYPDIIVSSIVVTTTHPPSSVISRSSGKLGRLFVTNQQRVKHGDLLAYIANTAQYDDVTHLKDELETLREHLIADKDIPPLSLRKDAALGTLQAAYADFWSCFDEYSHVVKQEYHHQQIASLNEQIEQNRSLHERAVRQRDLLQQELELSQRHYERHHHLKEQALVSQKDLDTLQSAVLQKTYALEEASANIDEIQLQITKLQASKQEVTYQYDEQEKKLRLELEEALDTLMGQIVLWEHTNVLYAPIDGTVTFTDYWSENQNVESGDVVMTIVPDGSNSLIGHVRLPIQGAGKVAAGQRVNIKFANYPYTEYGIVTGRIKDISLVPSDEGYVVTVHFPGSLTTSYGKNLSFTQEMQGTAEIITEDRRLLERMLQPLQILLKERIRSPVAQSF